MTDKLSEKQREAILARVPAGRLGAGADVAAAAVFLASQEAAYITGQTLHVNGGVAVIFASAFGAPPGSPFGGAALVQGLLGVRRTHGWTPLPIQNSIASSCFK